MSAARKPTKKSAPAATGKPRRSPCPVACALDLFGDRWTLLLVRDLFFGKSRFKDFTASPEGIPTNILADRLERLVERGIVIQTPASEGSRRHQYQLTAKGRSLEPVLQSIRDWALEWEPDTRAALES